MNIRGDINMKGKFEELFFDDKKKYTIVIAFFDWILRSDFKEVMNILARDMSYGGEVLGCNLPSLFESVDEEGYFNDGVEFYVDESEIKVDFQMYIKCLELAYRIYVREKGEDEEIKDNLLMIKKRYSKILE